MLSTLSNTSQKYRFLVVIYCFMPNHLHLLLEGDEHSDLKEFVRIYKQITAFDYKKTKGTKLWQRSYFDRVLRKEEDTITLIKYILENPIRWGLTTDWISYPYLGSLEYLKDDFRKSLL